MLAQNETNIKWGRSSGAMNFGPRYAGTNRVIDNGKEGIRMPDNWTRRGIPGLAFATIGDAVALKQ